MKSFTNFTKSLKSNLFLLSELLQFCRIRQVMKQLRTNTNTRKHEQTHTNTHEHTHTNRGAQHEHELGQKKNPPLARGAS